MFTSFPSLFLHNLVNQTLSPPNSTPNQVLDQVPHLSIRFINPKLSVPRPAPQVPRPPRTPFAFPLLTLTLLRFVCLEDLRVPEPMMK